MFAMGTGEEIIETPEHPRSRAILSLTELLTGLTGRVPAPVDVGRVVDDIVAWSNHTVMDNAVPVVPAKTRKGE